MDLPTIFYNSVADGQLFRLRKRNGNETKGNEAFSLSKRNLALSGRIHLHKQTPSLSILHSPSVFERLLAAEPLLDVDAHEPADELLCVVADVVPVRGVELKLACKEIETDFYVTPQRNSVT